MRLNTFPPRRYFNRLVCSGNSSGCFFSWVQASTWLWASLGDVDFLFKTFDLRRQGIPNMRPAFAR